MSTGTKQGTSPFFLLPLFLISVILHDVAANRAWCERRTKYLALIKWLLNTSSFNNNGNG